MPWDVTAGVEFVQGSEELGDQSVVTLDVLVAEQTGDALDIFEFVLIFLVIGVINFIFDDSTQHVKCIVYYGSILI